MYLIYMHVCMYTVVIILNSPENITVCRGSDMTINCGYRSSKTLPVTWIINETSLEESEIMNSSLYQLINTNITSSYSLEVFSINGTTTFQCVIHSDLDSTSTIGTVTVIGM